MVEAAAFQRVVHFARAVGSEHHNGRLRGVDGAEFRDRHLEIAECFQQESLKRLIGAVELIDQQHRRPAFIRAHRLQERAFDQVISGEEFVLQRGAVGGARSFCGADGDHLGGEVPLVDGAGGIKAFVALQPDQAAAQARGQCLGDLGLAGAGLALQEQRAAQFQRQEHHRGQRPAADIALAGEYLLNLID